MIDVQHISKSFDGVPVLKDISAQLYDGQVNMIIGQSGSGKTVLLKSLIGLHSVDSGRIEYINGDTARDLAGMNEQETRLLRREMGMLFQGAALFDSMSVEDNVLYPLEMFSDMSREDMVARAHYCLEHVNMPKHTFGLMPSEISGGQQKRVAIARAIVMNPKYLFCDEPNSGLDPKTSLVIDQLIHDITHEFGICTIVNSHDMNSIMEIGDNILFLKNGEKAWQGSKENIWHADSEALNDFVFASQLFKSIKNSKK